MEFSQENISGKIIGTQKGKRTKYVLKEFSKF